MMVRLLKEDQAGKSEEELAECFRVFDKYVYIVPAHCVDHLVCVKLFFKYVFHLYAFVIKYTSLFFSQERRRLHRQRGVRPHHPQHR